MKECLSKRRKGDEEIAYLFILPFLVMFSVFKLYPMAYGFAVSFLNRNSARHLADMTFVGFSNYAKALSNTTLWEAFGHTLLFSLIYTVSTMVCGLFFAVAFNKKFFGRTVVRTFFYMPYVTNMIAVGIVFKYLLNPTKGPANAVFRFLGFYGPLWLNSPRLALPMTALIGAWVSLAFNMITLLAALQDIPRDLYEVADIEGVSAWQRLRYVTLPYLTPTLFMLLTLTIINSFKNYTTIIGLTGGGPGTSTQVVSLQIYEDAFTYMKFSIASAEGVMFTFFIILVNKTVTKARAAWEAR
ncbi:MAG: sugar ABC transporter permease [Sphaerochaetaceae bacterium]